MENHIFFFVTSWKIIFLKKSRWNMIFLVLPPKTIFFPPKILSYPLEGKWKMIFLKKTHGNMNFVRVLWKDNLSKKTALEHDLPCIIWKDSTCFSWRHDLISLAGKYTETRYFLCIRAGITNVVLDPSANKNQRWPSPAQIHLKMIDMLGWHSRKGSNNSLYFYGDLYRRFHILLSSEKNQET